MSLRNGAWAGCSARNGSSCARLYCLRPMQTARCISWRLHSSVRNGATPFYAGIGLARKVLGAPAPPACNLRGGVLVVVRLQRAIFRRARIAVLTWGLGENAAQQKEIWVMRSETGEQTGEQLPTKIRRCPDLIGLRAVHLVDASPPLMASRCGTVCVSDTTR